MSYPATKNMRPRAGHYRISDIAKKIDRTSMTIFCWERNGLIPKAERDSRNWRMYSASDVQNIVDLARKTNCFSKKQT